MDHILIRERSALIWASRGFERTKLRFVATPAHYPILEEFGEPRKLGPTTFVVRRSAPDVLNVLSRHGYSIKGCHSCGTPFYVTRMYWTLAKELKSS
ncbi:hypothetical protein AAVH_16819 [Aphelenchoides avenae]|nr:hypothetical protein AAVH_16819 [Aphelenchus avenae]